MAGTLPMGYTIVVILEAVVSIAAVTVSGAAYYRRRSRSYLFVTLALSTLVIRSASGLLSAAGVYPVETLEILDHGLDIVMVSLLFGAVYYARRIDPKHT
ncbi:MAG: hypothetical protein IH933_15770 [Euryarchaeota archaeon]|nr:hypothetical protein [Euryarchaeota archaeon]